jgi:ribonuclease VapC
VTLDSSALVAVLFTEANYLDLVDRILEADHVRIGAPTLVEASFVYMGRLRVKTAAEAEAVVKELGISVVPFGEAEWQLAVHAFLKYGRGRHKAALNFGDCLAYASAAAVGDTLLFTGDDFRLTDIEPA